MKRINKSVLFLLLLALPAFAGQTASVTRPAELRTTPYADGKIVQTLPAGAKVDVVKRVGGWYQVKSQSGEGWVRMWLLRFSTPAGGFGRDSVAVLGSGRSSSTYTTATTGVRGLSEEELKNARPNPQAVAALEQLAVTPEDARGFAKKGKLKADPGLLKEAP